MKMNKQLLLASVSLAMLGGQAMASTITNITVGSQPVTGTSSYRVANEVAVTTSSPSGTLTFDLQVNNGILPSGNIVMPVSLTNAVFTAQVLGAAVVAIDTGTASTGTCGPITSVLSSGGGTATGSVTFVLSGADGCNIGDVLRVTLPVRATGAGPVDIAATLRTEGGTPVDDITPNRTGAITFVSAFAPAVAASTASDPQLTIASGFRQFTSAGANVLGAARVVPAYTSTTPGNTGTIYTNLAGTAVTDANFGTATITVTGDFTGFGTATTAAKLFLDLDGDNTIDSGEQFTVNTAGTTAVLTSSAVGLLTTTTGSVAIRVETGSSGTATANAILNSASYSGTVVSSYTGSGFSTATESASSALDSITREGTTILFPWTASATQNVASGSNNIIRLGNLGSAPVSAIFARVRNSSVAGYVNPGIVALGSSLALANNGATTLAVGGELTIDSGVLERALGNFGRGDVEIIVEADPSTLSTRRLIARPDGVFEFGSGRGN